jgi:hypothetical protein
MKTDKIAFGLACLASASVTLGVIQYNDGNVAGNVGSAPTGPYLNGGMQFTGKFVGSEYAGTAIAPSFILAAQHTGVGVGQFEYNSVTYNVVQVYNDPGSDLRLLRISGTFPTYAPLYRATGELNQTAVLLGRGWPGGTQVNTGPDRNGWNLDFAGSATAKPITWGANVVSDTVDLDSSFNIVPAQPAGKYLLYTFDEPSAGGLGAVEGQVVNGDSGGGAFVQDTDGLWKLAGVHYAASTQFYTSTTAPLSYGAIFDFNGLYVGPTATRVLVSETTPQPALGLSTRISTRQAWIDGIIPEPTTLTMVLGAGVVMLRRKK